MDLIFSSFRGQGNNFQQQGLSNAPRGLSLSSINLGAQRNNGRQRLLRNIPHPPTSFQLEEHLKFQGQFRCGVILDRPLGSLVPSFSKQSGKPHLCALPNVALGTVR